MGLSAVLASALASDGRHTKAAAKTSGRAHHNDRVQCQAILAGQYLSMVNFFCQMPGKSAQDLAFAGCRGSRDHAIGHAGHPPVCHGGQQMADGGKVESVVPRNSGFAPALAGAVGLLHPTCHRAFGMIIR